MTMDDASLSEHEQRVFEGIEKSLLEDDPDFVRRLREATPRKQSIRLLRFSILGLVAGLGLLLMFTVNVGFGALGFLLMLGGAVGIAVAVRNLSSSSGRPPGSSLLDALKRAETRIRKPRG